MPKAKKGNTGRAVDPAFEKAADGMTVASGGGSYNTMLAVNEEGDWLKGKFMGIALKAGVASPIITCEAVDGSAVTLGNKGVAGSGGAALVPGETYDFYAGGQLQKAFGNVVRVGKGKQSRVESVTAKYKDGTPFAVLCLGKQKIKKGDWAGTLSWLFDIRIDAKGKIR